MPQQARTAPKEADEVESDDKGKFIKFNGHNGVRTISKDEWEQVGVKGQSDSAWDRTNAWRLPRSDFNEKALNYLLNVDGEFHAED